VSGPLPPSARRLREARARGDVAHAPLLSAAAGLTAAALAAAVTAPATAARLLALARTAWAAGALRPAAPSADTIVSALARGALPIAGAAFVGALVGGLAQTRFAWAWRAFGVRRRDDDEPLALVGWAAAAALALTALSAGRTLAAALVRSDRWTATTTATATALAQLGPRLLALVALAGLGEWAWRSARLREALSMSRAERERERREDEGDPRLRAEQRRRARAVSRDPLADELTRAQVVVTAEGVAVALRLVDGVARVAAAADERLRAQRLTAIARRLRVPLRPDDELAQALASLPANSVVPPRWQTAAQAALRSRRR
jgi:flagellar biosynthesis protein FlhB